MNMRLSLGSVLLCLVCTMALLSQFSTPVYSEAQRYSDSQLIQIGQDVYSKGDYVGALMFLFAYIQKNPQVLSTNPQFRAEVQTAYEFCLRQVRSAWDSRQVASSASATNQSGVGSKISGMGSAPPPLR